MGDGFAGDVIEVSRQIAYHALIVQEAWLFRSPDAVPKQFHR